MGDLINYILHLGIVRVLSVPIAMGLAVWILYRMAEPPEWHDDGENRV